MNGKASEGLHWYLPDGQPFYTVKDSEGKDRPARLDDARKVNAVPSVTTILRVIAKPGLSNYFEREIFDATLDMSWEEGDNSYDLFNRVKEQSRQKGAAASERGSDLHANIEEYLVTGKPFEGKWQKHCEAVLEAMVVCGFDPGGGKFAVERTFVDSGGYGGKVDYSEPFKVADFKSKERISSKKRYAYPDHAIQLAAYRHGLGTAEPGYHGAECWNFFVGADDAVVLPYQWNEKELVTAWNKFFHIFQYWQLENNYCPNKPF
jgi:hypothetical protein